MRKLVTSLFISLDGVVEADNDWQFAYLDDETFGALTTAWDRVDAALMGRRSFEGFDEVRRANPTHQWSASCSGSPDTWSPRRRRKWRGRSRRCSVATSTNS